MKFRNNNKRGQVAVEFLMTYGWMLLIVLIVGALVFSFVDFGGLLPNTLEFEKNFRADASQMNIEDESITLVLDYIGTSGRISINATQVTFTDDLNNDCGGDILNTSGSMTGIRTFSQDNPTWSNATPPTLQMSRGDGLVVIIECTSPTLLVPGDSVVGTVVIPYTDIRNKVVHTSEGNLRASVN